MSVQQDPSQTVHDALQPVCSAEALRGQLLAVGGELLDAAREPLLQSCKALVANR